MTKRPTLLLLAGTQDGYALAAECVERFPGFDVLSSFAGRTQAPRLPAGALRMGGFGGAAGLAHSLHQLGVVAVVDATHPFARQIGWHAAEACAQAQIPLLRLERPAWQPCPEDRWHFVTDWEQALPLLRSLARRVFLAVGRQELAPFAALRETFFLIRSIHAPQPMPDFAQAQIVLARGPFSLADEQALLREHQIEAMVCKNSGGPTDAKLAAARAAGIPVILRRRPPRPAEVPVVASVAEAVAWLAEQV